MEFSICGTMVLSKIVQILEHFKCGINRQLSLFQLPFALLFTDECTGFLNEEFRWLVCDSYEKVYMVQVCCRIVLLNLAIPLHIFHISL